MPILEAYTLTEQCPEIVQPSSFLTGILASHLLGDKTLAKKRALKAADSLRRRHPLQYPLEWDKGLEQEKLTGKGIKAWVINLGIDALGAAHVCLYRDRKGDWHLPEGEQGTAETHREAASKIVSKQLGIIIPLEAWQHIGEEDNEGNITQNWVYYREEHVEEKAKAIIRIDGGSRAEDSTTIKWVEIQKCYLSLQARRVLNASSRVGMPLRDLLRTRSPHLMLAAKEEVQAIRGIRN